MTRSLKYGLLLAAALAAPASAVDSDLTEAIAYHCGWQLGQFGMQSTDITKEELPKCKEIRLRANLIHQTQEEVQKTCRKLSPLLVVLRTASTTPSQYLTPTIANVSKPVL
jgi:hypothetical protein